jgi:hypothetical protein
MGFLTAGPEPGSSSCLRITEIAFIACEAQFQEEPPFMMPSTTLGAGALVQPRSNLRHSHPGARDSRPH